MTAGVEADLHSAAPGVPADGMVYGHIRLRRPGTNMVSDIP